MTTATGRVVEQAGPPAHLPARVRADWVALLTRPEPSERFVPASVAGLPEPARRWLEHAIAPGTLLRTSVELTLHGQIRLGRWRDFTARQALAPCEGYVWASQTRLAGGPVTGFDRLTHDEGEMRHVWRGRVPVTIASGPDVTRSAAGRLVAELPLVPAAALSPSLTWHPVDDTEVVLSVPCAGRRHDVSLRVEPSGALRDVRLLRWAKVGHTPYLPHLFVATFEGEATFDGFTVPRQVVAGYEEPGRPLDDTAFIRQVVDLAVYR